MMKPGECSRLWLREITSIIGAWVPVVLLLLTASAAWAGAPIQITSVSNPSVTLQINAYGGAKHGTTLKVVSNCPAGNTDCTWTLLPNGMIVSDTDRTLAWNAYGGAAHGANVTLVNNCRPDITDCTWTVRDDGLIVSNTNFQLAVNAYGGVVHEAPLKLVNNCAPQLDGCKWLTARALYSAETNNAFAVNAYGGAKHGTELQVVQNCPADNSDCLWLFQSDGMILSGTNTGLAWNAYGGAKVGTKVTLVVGCPANNSDCQWDLRPDGLIVSRTNPNLAVKAQGGPHHIAPLVLVNDCTPAIAGCKWSGMPQSSTANVDIGRHSPIFNPHLNDPGKPLRGFVDLHTHPMAHLGFGGHVVHGAPDIGVQMPVDMIYDSDGGGIFQFWRTTCNTEARSATKIEEALGSSNSTHGGPGDDNKCGNIVRKAILEGMEKKYHSHLLASKETLESGYPRFTHWPAYNDILHQMMWWEWIKRAKEGGMRVLVALAVNNLTLAYALQPNVKTPITDQPVAELQIEELKNFVGKHQDFMEIAYSSRDLRRIVESDRLAVVIGVEIDDIGNLIVKKQLPGEDLARQEIRQLFDQLPSEEVARQKIRELYDLGVRYAFPVHVVDNYFGGTAAYEGEFALANRFQFGHWMKLTCSGGEGISKRIKTEGESLLLLNALKLGAGEQPLPNCAAGEGFKNERGLQPLGRVVLDEMMKLGMLIDIDHMSQQTANDTLARTRQTGGTPADQYPIVSGHNGLRGVNPQHNSENQRTSDQYREIAARGGLAGVGFGGSNAPDFLRDANAVSALGIPVNLGSDINGLIDMPHPPDCRRTQCPQYGPAFPQARMGEKVWDYSRDGVAHIGLFPDFLKHVENLFGGPPLVDKLYNGAEAFAKMWEKAARISQKIRPASPPTPTGPGGSTGSGGHIDPDDQPLKPGQKPR